jgi:hypothetical protein
MATDWGAVVPFALILKVARRREDRMLAGAQRDITVEFNRRAQAGIFVGQDWRRESLVYESGLLDELPGGLAAPRCCGVLVRSEDELWIWLEEVKGEPGTEWSRERIVRGARHLGQFNGEYLARQSLPLEPWLLRGMLRRWIVHLKPSVDQLLAGLYCRFPPLERGWPPHVADALLRVWNERHLLCDELDRLPQTLCHHDANGRNLIARRTAGGCEKTVALDWDFVGIGPTGYDIVPLCGELLPSFSFSLLEARDIVEAVFQGYLAGLRDAGWPGDRNSVRLGFTAALALRYGVCGAPANLGDLLDEKRHSIPEQRWGSSMDQIMDRWAGCARFMLGLADEARGLLGQAS